MTWTPSSVWLCLLSQESCRAHWEMSRCGTGRCGPGGLTCARMRGWAGTHSAISAAAGCVTARPPARRTAPVPRPGSAGHPSAEVRSWLGRAGRCGAGKAALACSVFKLVHRNQREPLGVCKHHLLLGFPRLRRPGHAGAEGRRGPQLHRARPQQVLEGWAEAKVHGGRQPAAGPLTKEEGMHEMGPAPRRSPAERL
jgi:hypothetical protein